MVLVASYKTCCSKFILELDKVDMSNNQYITAISSVFKKRSRYVYEYVFD